MSILRLSSGQVFGALEVYHDIDSRSAALNMAIDEVLLETATAPTIRFYRWDHRALSFGYFVKFAEVKSYAGDHDLVRRWTGGGIVVHGQDLTYSIIIPTSDPGFAESAMSIYEKVHCALRDTFETTGEAEVVSAIGDRDAGIGDGGYNCFAHPVRGDVMIDGRKVAGAAQRRTRAGLLHQGSIQNVDLSNGLSERFALALSPKCQRREIGKGVLTRAAQIAKLKYGSESWSRRF